MQAAHNGSPYRAGGKHTQIVAVLHAGREQLAQKHVVSIYQGHVKLAKWFLRVQALLPTLRQVMRLEMRQFKSVPDGQRRQELMLGTQLGGDFVNDIDVFASGEKASPVGSRQRHPDCQAYRVLDMLSEFPEELLDLLWSGGVHDSPPQ